MGLDSYLTRHITFKDGLNSITTLQTPWHQMSPQVLYDCLKPSTGDSVKLNNEEISTNFFYRRKEWWLHTWFSVNCAHGNEESQEVPVTIDDLKHLVNDIQKILNRRITSKRVLNDDREFFVDPDEKNNPEMIEIAQENREALKGIQDDIEQEIKFNDHLKTIENIKVTYSYYGSW